MILINLNTLLFDSIGLENDKQVDALVWCFGVMLGDGRRNRQPRHLLV